MALKNVGMRAMLKKLLNDTAGNFSIMMAGGVLALMGGIGLSVGYMAVTDQAAQMQAAVDGAALAAVLSDEDEQADIEVAADELFASLRSQGIDVESDYIFSETTITVKATSIYRPRIMSILGFGARPISVSAKVPAGGGAGLDITLVLDVTDSMDENGKLGQMQDAVNRFLNELNADGGAGGVRVSVVPFSQYVNVGVENASQPWIDNSQEGSTFPPSVQEIIVTEDCPVPRVPETRTRTTDGVTRTVNVNVCPVNRESEQVGENIIEPVKSWDGCVGSRAGNLSVQAEFNGSPFLAVYNDGNEAHTRYRGTDYACPPDAVLPLTDNIAAAQTLVGDFDTSGNTYMPSGLAWGWRTLDDGVPLGRPLSGEPRSKALVLMTDGFNTVSQRGPDADLDNDGRYHHGRLNQSSAVTDEANAVTATLCSNIAADDIQIFTIAYEFPNGGDAAAGRTLLENCATQGGFFDATNASQLNAAFTAIGESLKDIRLIN